MFPQQPMTWDFMEFPATVESQVEVLKSENIARAVVRKTTLQKIRIL